MNKKKHTTICLVAGHSGGHIIPALTLAKTIKKDSPESEIILFSTNAALDKEIIAQATCIDKHYTLPLAYGSTRHWRHYPGVLFNLALAFIQSFAKLKRCRVLQVISFGGLVSIPVCFASWFLRIPITLYELNVVPGKAATLVARLAERIHVCFTETAWQQMSSQKEKITQGHYPLRFTDEDTLTCADARARLGIARDAKVLLILGGSKGSYFLNTFAQGYVRHKMLMSPEKFSSLAIFHQAGTAFKNEVEAFYKSYGITASVFAYTADIALYYPAADFVIARAGAGTLFELVFFKKKSLIVPLETQATTHQLNNAYSIATQYPDHFTVYRQISLERHPDEAYNYLDSFL